MNLYEPMWICSFSPTLFQPIPLPPPLVLSMGWASSRGQARGDRIGGTHFGKSWKAHGVKAWCRMKRCVRLETWDSVLENREVYTGKDLRELDDG